MALGTPTLLDATVSTSNNNTITSGSFSPTANALLILVATWRDNGNNYRTGITDTLTGTGSWTVHEEVSVNLDGSNYTGITIATAQAGSSPGSGTITYTLIGSSTRKVIQVFEITGFDTTTPVKNTKSGSGTGSSTPSLTLDSSPDGDSCVLGGLVSCGEAVSDISPGTNYAELDESGYQGTPDSGKIESEVEYDSTPTSTTVDWSGAGTTANVYAAIEIDAAAGGSPYTLTCDADSLSFSGTATTLIKNHPLTAEAGTLDFAPYIHAGGWSILLIADRLLDAQAGALTFAGQDCDLIYSGGAYELTAEAGTLDFAPTIINTPNHNVWLIVDRRLDAQAGALTFSGTAAGLVADHTLSCEAEALSFSGTAVTFVSGYGLACEAEALTFTGTAAGLVKDSQLAAAAGALTFAGTAAGLIYSSGAAATTLTANLLCNPSPTFNQSINPTPAANVKSNPSPAVDIEIA